MTDRIWLIRHGATAWTGRRWCGTTDLPLTLTGRVQVRRLAARLAGRVPADAVVISSPARRAVETAQALVAPGRSVAIVEELREVDFGAAEGLTWRQLERTLPALGEAVASGATLVDWPNGEQGSALRRRVDAVLERINEAPRPLVIVTHGGVARALLGEISMITDPLGAPSAFDHSLAPASALELVRTRAGWVVEDGGI
jgi:broad specificity phosphatase PhoE